MAEARGRFAAAKASLASGFPPAAISLAYYAMLYAARAALSEEDRYAKTHKGTWLLFDETFVPDRFEDALFRAAERTLPLRIGTDYEALRVEHEDGARVVDLAERFIAAIEKLFPD